MQQSSPTMLLKLPPKIRHRIYALAIPFSRIEIEVTDTLSLLTKHSPLLQISRVIRSDILDACSSNTIELIHTFRSPTSLIAANSAGLSSSFENIRIVLLAWIEDNNISLEEEVLNRNELQAINGLARGWRTAFSGLPSNIPLQTVYFDFSNSFAADVHQPAKLLNILSAVVQRRSQRQARCRIIGCKTRHGQRFLENHTVGVVREFPNWEAEKVQAWKEREAGMEKKKQGPKRDYPLRSEVSAEEYERWEDWARRTFGKGDSRARL